MEKEIFTWTESEVELLLECTKTYASDCIFQGKDWESVKTKYDKIRGIFVERYPKPDNNSDNDEYPKSSSLDSVTKERVATKIKALRKKYKKAVDLGKRSGGGRIILTYYDLCRDIWGGAPATTSIKSGIDSSTLNFENSDSQTQSPTNASICIDSTPDFEEENLENETPKSTNTTQPCDRRERISRFLKDEREKRMNSKVSLETQQLRYIKEDIEFRKRTAQEGEITEKELLNETKRIRVTMEGMATAMTSCFQMMQSVLQTQMQQHPHYPHPQSYPAGIRMNNLVMNSLLDERSQYNHNQQDHSEENESLFRMMHNN